MKEWPEDRTELVRIEDLIKPLVDSLQFVIANGGEDIPHDVEIPYEGYNIGESIRHVTLTPAAKLEAWFREREEEQGRNIYHVLFVIAFQLGIESGVRLHRRDQSRLLPVFRSILENLPEKDLPMKKNLLNLLGLIEDA